MAAFGTDSKADFGGMLQSKVHIIRDFKAATRLANRDGKGFRKIMQHDMLA